MLLVRDPRDVVVSNFFQVHRRERGADGREATPDEVGAFMRDYLDADDCAFMDAYIEATLAAGYGYRGDERGAVA